MFDVILIVLILILIGLIIFVNTSKTPIFDVFGKERKSKEHEIMTCRSPTPDFISKANSRRSVSKQMPVQKNKNNKNSFFEYTVVSSNSTKSNERKAYVKRDIESNETKTFLPKSLFPYENKKAQEQSNTQSKYEKTRSRSSSNNFNYSRMNKFEYTVVSSQRNQQKPRVFERNENSSCNYDELPIFQPSEPVTNPCRFIYNSKYHNSRFDRSELPYF